MLPNVTRILYCTDLSKNASFAFNYAAYLTKLTGAEMHILHVVEKLSADAYFALQTYVQNDASRDDFLHHRLDSARKRLAERQEQFWSMQAPEDRTLRERIASVDIVENDPAESILQRSRSLNCDLIVMGAHEKGYVMHSFLGSIAKSVLRHSRVPTLIVPLPDKPQTKLAAVK